MSLRSQEHARRSENRKLLRQRRRAIEAKNFSRAARLGIRARRALQKAQAIHQRRVGDFNVSMLDGHPANIADQVKRAIALAYKYADARGYACTVTATTDGTHAVGSWHYPLPGRNALGFAVDLIFATKVQMEAFQAYCETHTAGRDADFYELFGPANFYVKDGTRVVGHFPGHEDHDHIAPKLRYRSS